MKRSLEERRKMLEKNINLVYSCVNKYDIQGEQDKEDAIQEGMTRLWRSTATWDKSKGSLSTYVYSAVSKEIGLFLYRRAGVTGKTNNISYTDRNKAEVVVVKNKDKTFDEIMAIVNDLHYNVDKNYLAEFYNRTMNGSVSLDAILDKQDESVNVEKTVEDDSFRESIFHLIDKEIRRKMSPKNVDVYRRYVERIMNGDIGVYTSTGREFGLSHERVRQIASKGNLIMKKLLSDYKR